MEGYVTETLQLPSKTTTYAPYTRRGDARSRLSSDPAVGRHPPAQNCVIPAPGRNVVKATTAPLSANAAAAAAAAAVAAAVAMTVETVIGTAVVVAVVTAARTLVVAVETCTIRRSLPGVLTPPVAATETAWGSSFPMPQETAQRTSL